MLKDEREIAECSVEQMLEAGKLLIDKEKERDMKEQSEIIPLFFAAMVAKDIESFHRGWYISTLQQEGQIEYYLFNDGVARHQAIDSRSTASAFWPNATEALKFYDKWAREHFGEGFSAYVEGASVDEMLAFQEELQGTNGKKGIKIQFQKFFMGEHKWVRILNIESLHANELPEEYLNSRQAVWMDGCECCLHFNLTNNLNNNVILSKNQELPFGEFLKLMNYVEKAGHNLTKINRKLKRQQEWEGLVTRII